MIGANLAHGARPGVAREAVASEVPAVRNPEGTPLHGPPATLRPLCSDPVVLDERRGYRFRIHVALATGVFTLKGGEGRPDHGVVSDVALEARRVLRMGRDRRVCAETGYVPASQMANVAPAHPELLLGKAVRYAGWGARKSTELPEHLQRPRVCLSDSFRGDGHSEVTRFQLEHVRLNRDRLLGAANRKWGWMRGLVRDSREHVTDKKNQTQHQGFML